jgi:hypothetical protein
MPNDVHVRTTLSGFADWRSIDCNSGDWRSGDLRRAGVVAAGVGREVRRRLI